MSYVRSTQVAASTPVDPVNTPFSSTDLQDMVEMLNKFTFSWRSIASAKSITVAAEQSMSTYQEINLDDGAELNIEGEVIIYA